MPEPSAGRPDELDVRQMPKPQRHPLIFSRFAALPPSGSFVLVNSHDPKHLHQEFERDHPGTYTWQYLETGPTWRIQITKLSATDLPRILVNAAALSSSAPPTGAAGAVWKLEISERHLDANIIHLQPDGQIELPQAQLHIMLGIPARRMYEDRLPVGLALQVVVRQRWPLVGPDVLVADQRQRPVVATLSQGLRGFRAGQACAHDHVARVRRRGQLFRGGAGCACRVATSCSAR
jgi:uncharacterized protein (DUF2249 family)